MKNRTLGRIAILAVLVLTAAAAGVSKEPVVQSAWMPEPPTVDGMDADWAEAVFSTEAKMGIDYAFRNDGSYLYLLFRFNDPNYLSSISATGMTIYFSSPDKKNKDYAIKFLRKAISADDFIAIVEKREGPLSDEQKAEYKANPVYYMFDSEVDSKQKDKNAEAVGELPEAEFRSAVVGKTTILEFGIPLSRAMARAPGVGFEPGQSVKVGFEWGGMTKEMKEAMMRRRAAMSSQASQGASDFNVSDETGDTGSVSGDRTLPFQRGAKKYSFWVDVQLAGQQ